MASSRPTFDGCVMREPKKRNGLPTYNDLRAALVASRVRERDLKRRITDLKWDNRSLRTRVSTLAAIAATVQTNQQSDEAV